MKVGGISKSKKLLNNWVLCLIIITGIAIIIRSIPAWTNAAWGCDFGIYYGLAKSFVQSGGEWYNPYSGWGSSYNYFPVLYAVTGFAHWITGIDIIVLMPKLVPIFGGLSVFIFYFVVNSLIKDRKIALISALFLAVLPFDVYQTSHASPLTMGHFFMMLSLLFFIKFRQKVWYVMPLFISTVLLIMSHHLTTYFYIISLVFIIFTENASNEKWTSWLKRDVFYFLCASGLTFSYWAFVARPVFEGFMGGGASRGISLGFISIKSTYLVVFFYVLFFSSFGLIYLIRRFNAFIIREKQNVKAGILKFFILFVWEFNPFIKKELHSLRKRVLLFFIVLIFFYGIMIFFLIFKMPWTNFSFTPLAVALSTPLLFVFAFWVSGFRYTWHIRNGLFIRGWTFGLTISLLYAAITDNHTILPDRHLEYMMAPVAIITVYGIGGIFLNLDYEKLSKKIRKGLHTAMLKTDITAKKRFTKNLQLVYSLVIFLLVITNALSVYPAFESLEQASEVITAEDISAIEWIRTHLDKNTSVIVSDHRLERMVEAEGFNTSDDKVYFLWSDPEDDKENYIQELFGIGINCSYSRITHVLIDDIMKNIVVHVGPRIEGINMSYESHKKFGNRSLFKEPIYFNATQEINGEPVHWAAVYEVNWDYFTDKSVLKDITKKI